MSIEKVRKYFAGLGMENRIIEFSTSSATVALAAVAVGCEEARICKTLSFMGKEGPLLILTAGDVKIDNHKYKEKFGVKAKMLTVEQAETLIGHAVGGICPFGINAGITVYLDVSMQRFATMFPACGSSNSAIELTIEELEKYSGFDSWIDVCKASK